MSSLPFLLRARRWLAATENHLLLLLLVLVAFPIFYELGRNPVQLWDESRMAVNAFEMSRDGHWLVPHFNGEPDHWNTKPPLLIWLEALSFRLFGYSALALRLPVAIGNLLTALSLFWFGRRTLNRPLAGFFGALILVTCNGFIRLHVGRTGDYDAMLTCWVTLGWIQFFQYLETSERRHMLWCAAAITVATLTKTTASLMIVPGLVMYTLVQRRLLWLLRQPVVYVAAAGWLLVIGGYYLVREGIDPGYWKVVQYNDMGGRFTQVQGSHPPYWGYYLERLFTSTFRYWLWAAIVGVSLGLLQADARLRRATWLALAVATGWLLVLSASVSQHSWYDAPLYPALALLAGIGVAQLYHDALERYLPRLSPWQSRLSRLAIGALLLLLPYWATIRQIVEERYSDFDGGPDGHLARYVVTLSKERPGLDSLTLLRPSDYNAVFDFYKNVHNLKLGRHMEVGGWEYGPGLPLRTVVVICNPAYRPGLDSAFRVVTLHQQAACQTLLLLPKPRP